MPLRMQRKTIIAAATPRTPAPTAIPAIAPGASPLCPDAAVVWAGLLDAPLAVLLAGPRDAREAPELIVKVSELSAVSENNGSLVVIPEEVEVSSVVTPVAV